MAEKDKFGRHELLDRSHLLMDNVAEWLLDHKGIKPSEKKLAKKALKALADLYQLLGSRNIGRK